jgi:hypothetical protein
MVNPSHITCFIGVHPVVVGDPARIGTEFFVGATAKTDAAFKA